MQPSNLADIRRWTAIALAIVAGMALAGTRVTAQQAPPLTSEELLQLVLPLDAGGRRPPVIAWARLDTIVEEGTPETFVAVLWETTAPFGQTELRRLVNRVRWNGRAYEPVARDEPGEVLEGEPRRLALRSWSVEIDITADGGEGNATYTVTYAGAGALGERGSGALRLTELFRPTGELLWRRITHARETAPRAAGGVETRQVDVTFHFEAAADADRLIAVVVETITFTTAPGGTPQMSESREYIETYVLRDGMYRLETREPAP